MKGKYLELRLEKSDVLERLEAECGDDDMEAIINNGSLRLEESDLQGQCQPYMNQLYLYAPAKWKTRIWHTIHTDGPVHKVICLYIECDRGGVWKTILRQLNTADQSVWADSRASTSILGRKCRIKY